MLFRGEVRVDSGQTKNSTYILTFSKLKLPAPSSVAQKCISHVAHLLRL